MYVCVCVLFTRKELLLCFRYVLDMFYLHEYYVIYTFYVCKLFQYTYVLTIYLILHDIYIYIYVPHIYIYIYDVM